MPAHFAAFGGHVGPVGWPFCWALMQSTRRAGVSSHTRPAASILSSSAPAPLGDGAAVGAICQGAGTTVPQSWQPVLSVNVTAMSGTAAAAWSVGIAAGASVGVATITAAGAIGAAWLTAAAAPCANLGRMAARSDTNGARNQAAKMITASHATATAARACPLPASAS